MQTELFEDSTHEEVTRNAVLRQLGFANAANSNRLQPSTRRRQLASTCANPPDWGGYGPLLGSHEASVEGYFIFEIVYSARDGQSILRPTEIQQVLIMEQAVRAWMQSAGACATNTSTSLCHCSPPDTALNYLFASRTNASLVFDGLGIEADIHLATAGLKCGAALTSMRTLWSHIGSSREAARI